jgi:hypothetical protein
VIVGPLPLRRYRGAVDNSTPMTGAGESPVRAGAP